MEDVLDIAKHVLEKFKKYCPQIERLVTKSDNAGCYSSNGQVIKLVISQFNYFRLLIIG